MAPATSPVPELEVWVDAHTQHLIDVDVLDYPGACEAADKAVIAAQMRADYARKLNQPGRQVIMPRGYGQLGRPLYPSLTIRETKLQQRAWEDARELGIV